MQSQEQENIANLRQSSNNDLHIQDLLTLSHSFGKSRLNSSGFMNKSSRKIHQEDNRVMEGKSPLSPFSSKKMIIGNKAGLKKKSLKYIKINNIKKQQEEETVAFKQSHFEDSNKAQNLNFHPSPQFNHEGLGKSRSKPRLGKEIATSTFDECKLLKTPDHLTKNRASSNNLTLTLKNVGQGSASTSNFNVYQNQTKKSITPAKSQTSLTKEARLPRQGHSRTSATQRKSSQNSSKSRGLKLNSNIICSPRMEVNDD